MATIVKYLYLFMDAIGDFLLYIILNILSLIIIVPRIIKDRKQVYSNIHDFKYANFGLRALAFLLDIGILIVLSVIIENNLNLLAEDTTFNSDGLNTFFLYLLFFTLRFLKVVL